MSHYSKINIVSEYLTPNGYLFNGYSDKDLPEIFLQQLKKVIDFDVHIVRTNEDDGYHHMDVHSPFLNYLKEYTSKFHNTAHRKPIIEFKIPSQIEDGELNDDVLNIFLAESDTRSAFKLCGLENLSFSKKSLDLIRDNKNCVIIILDWREGSYRLPNELITHFNEFMQLHKLKKTDLFFINNDFQIKSNQPKCNFSLTTFPWYILIGFDDRIHNEFDSTGNKISFTTATEAFDAYETIREYKFLSYNRNSNRLHRPYVVSKLHNDNILKDSLVSLYESRALSEYDSVLKTISNLEFETLFFSKEDRVILKKMVDEVYPLKLDHLDADTCARANNQISTKYHFLNSYINIVCETSCHSEYTFITEKTLRPIINLQPFLLFGNPFTLVELHNLGFKTFNKWIDEGYDTETDTNKRFELAYAEVKRLSEMDIDEIHELYYEMFDVLEHNFNRLNSIYKNYELPAYLGNSIYENLKLI
jgi:hypothetical protein